MREVRYQLIFEGKVSTEDEMGTIMRVEARATFGPNMDDVFSLGAPQAVLTSSVEPNDHGGFHESGEIVFGGGTLVFVSDGEGHIGDCADPTRQQGAAIWRIENGTGAFAGASGTITSVFTVSEDAQIRDSQSAVIFLA